jgi:hypothetical protein
LNSMVPRTRNSIARRVLPHPALPQTRVSAEREPSACDFVKTLNPSASNGVALARAPRHQFQKRQTKLPGNRRFY